MLDFNSEFADVAWNEEAGVAVLGWKKFAAGDDFKLPCRRALDLGIQKGAVHWFSDTTELGALREEDCDWFLDEIVSGMLKKGITAQALIIPQSVISKMTLYQASEAAVDLGLETRYFDNRADALKWLQGRKWQAEKKTAEISAV
ncbi:MAG: hypothetical protein PQJ61_08020 [Spirochaetales bacterium]|uniref:SpoIIAA-like n=1 Tax=Candidatus Thalassospirochaeta sargassi TaxID=3119039 RepID=A0AAJ1MJM4_9SPIO|nr:hypothetical protein [Spirochaetales bacterium]